MEVWLFGKEPQKFDIVKTDKVSIELVKKWLKERGIRKARVVVYHDRDPEPDEWGVITVDFS